MVLLVKREDGIFALNVLNGLKQREVAEKLVSHKFIDEVHLALLENSDTEGRGLEVMGMDDLIIKVKTILR